MRQFRSELRYDFFNLALQAVTKTTGKTEFCLLITPTNLYI